MNERNWMRGPEHGPKGRRPDIVTASKALGVTEEALKGALGDPRQRPPHFGSVAEALGVTEEALMEALGMPGGEQLGDGRP